MQHQEQGRERRCRASSRWGRAAVATTLWSAVITSSGSFTQTLRLIDITVSRRDKSKFMVRVSTLFGCPAGLHACVWFVFCLPLQREDFQMYEKYCQNKPRSESLWRQCSESTFFQVSGLSLPMQASSWDTLILNTLLRTLWFCSIFCLPLHGNLTKIEVGDSCTHRV